MECISPEIYTHFALNEEHIAISGHYVVTREVRLPFRGREILYLTGYSVVDSSCCGVGGCGYSLVQGFVLNWKNRKNAEGLDQTDYEPIRDLSIKDELQKIIDQRETVTQINFM
ncbi:MAG: hypothetical protein HN580_12400 [Deltaproteobacteria bacterium]|nr:hypothetical protein [Deltaproteobacteria bacterium]MBT4642324.1 hypothetical protein [Deltaproteobacteria bacterium]MBT7151707.1 hypothetical protein [Deltaproteobacteria bacterium]MBT7710169.1 hypothetical protein [Deltaproteobacteria bacterium]MBT7889816.1 hypothetical protein [Deltaproteobacteria bacterium]